MMLTTVITYFTLTNTKNSLNVIHLILYTILSPLILNFTSLFNKYNIDNNDIFIVITVTIIISLFSSLAYALKSRDISLNRSQLPIYLNIPIINVLPILSVTHRTTRFLLSCKSQNVYIYKEISNNISLKWCILMIIIIIFSFIIFIISLRNIGIFQSTVKNISLKTNASLRTKLINTLRLFTNIYKNKIITNYYTFIKCTNIFILLYINNNT